MESKEKGMRSGAGRQATRILGIDPGTAATGWAILRREGNRMRAEGWGVIRTKAADPLPQRLIQLSAALEERLASTSPDAVAIEQAFLGKNVQSSLRLGEARGALMLTCARAGIPIWEYPTATVKKAVVGNGRADKTQVQFMLQRLLNLEKPPEPLDASDALALAFTLGTDWSAKLVSDGRQRRR